MERIYVTGVVLNVLSWFETEDATRLLLILVLPLIHQCVLAVYTWYFPEFCENKSQAYDSSWIRTHELCSSRAVSYQLDQTRLQGESLSKGL